MEATGTSALQMLESFPDADKSSLRDFENALLSYGLHNPQNTEGQDESSSDSEQEYYSDSGGGRQRYDNFFITPL
jgi:hypothetical protein